MSEHLFTLIQITYTVVFPAVLGWIVSIIKKHNFATDNGKQADTLLLRKALIDIHEESMKQGFITQYSFQCFEDIWRLYHENYHGNTLTDRFREEIHELPIQ